MKLETSDIVEEVEPADYGSFNEEISSDVKELHETRVDYIKAKTEQIHTENRGKGISDDLRKEMADKTFAFMERFSVFSAIVLWIYISLHLSKGNPIPENVMIALITTTFVTVIGLVGFILKGLFGTK